MTTTSHDKTVARIDLAIQARERYLTTNPVVINCPGCGVPIRQPAGTVFTAAGNWCAGCGGSAPIATPSEPGTADAYTDAARMAGTAR